MQQPDEMSPEMLAASVYRHIAKNDAMRLGLLLILRDKNEATRFNDTLRQIISSANKDHE